MKKAILYSIGIAAFSFWVWSNAHWENCRSYMELAPAPGLSKNQYQRRIITERCHDFDNDGLEDMAVFWHDGRVEIKYGLQPYGKMGLKRLEDIELHYSKSH